MTKKKKPTTKSFPTPAPFGIASIRFESIGFHPQLDKTGSMKKDRLKIGPGEYEDTKVECTYKKYNIGGSSWKRKQDCEEFSKHLGFRNAHILKAREQQKTFGGPGFYDVSEQIFKKHNASCMYNVGFGAQKRFWKLSSSYPPPGTYNVKSQTKRQFTHLPPFEWDGFIDRLRNKAPPWIKAPNRYNPEDGRSINALLARVVSKRGPYDLFTGPRDDSTIKNKFAPSKFKGPVNFFNTYPTEFEIFLNHPKNQRRGKFLTDGRFGRVTQRHLLDDPSLIYRNPDDPSPCTYDLDIVKEFKQNLAPFNQSVLHSRPPIKWRIHPGVGRYNPKYSTCHTRKPKSQSWMFKSKIGRPQYKAIEYNSF